jgi:ABC-type glycerol-3-phosphate transport system permease component
MVLYYGVGHWNSYFNAMIYLDDRNKYPLQLFLREILLQSKFIEESLLDSGNLSPEDIATLMELAKSADLTKYCVIVVAALPMMVIYPKLQKFFVKGVMIGSVKG